MPSPGKQTRQAKQLSTSLRPTNRLLWSFLVVACFSLLAAFWPFLKWPMLCLDGLWLGVVFWEWSELADPRQLRIERRLPERVGLQRAFERDLRVSLQLKAGGGPSLRGSGPWVIEVREDYADNTLPLASKSAPAEPRVCERGSLTPESPLVWKTSFRGLRRGAAWFRSLRVSVLGPRGLLWREVVLPGAQAVAVEPAVEGLPRILRLAASERWFDLGVRTLQRRGGQTEFDNLRDYVHGDDLRQLDWKAFAKHGRPLVREYREERGQELIVVVDSGRAMAVQARASETDSTENPANGLSGGGEVDPGLGTRLDCALDAALILASVAIQAGDRVGLLVFDSSTRLWLPPAKGARQRDELREALFDLQPRDVYSDLSAALSELRARHRRRATVVIFSEVEDRYSSAEQARALRSLGRRHRAVFAAFEEPTSSAAPALIEAQGPKADSFTYAQIAAHQESEQRQASLDELSASGAQVLSLPCKNNAARLLGAWLAGRSGSRGARRGRSQA